MPRIISKVVTSNYDFVSSYLEALNGVLRLSTSELLLLSEVVLAEYELRFKLNQEEVERYLYSYEFRDVLYETVSKDRQLTTAHLNNLFRALQKKELILSTKNGFRVEESLLPVKELIFKFSI